MEVPWGHPKVELDLSLRRFMRVDIMLFQMWDIVTIIGTLFFEALEFAHWHWILSIRRIT